VARDGAAELPIARAGHACRRTNHGIKLDKTGTELRRVLKEILDPAEENFSENREDESNAGFERYPGNGKWPMFERRD
jgi:hypothetical protein